MTFIQLKMEEGGRDRDQVGGGGTRGSKGQRKEHGHAGVGTKGRTWGREDKRGEWTWEGWIWAERDWDTKATRGSQRPAGVLVPPERLSRKRGSAEEEGELPGPPAQKLVTCLFRGTGPGTCRACSHLESPYRHPRPHHRLAHS